MEKNIALKITAQFLFCQYVAKYLRAAFNQVFEFLEENKLLTETI